MANRIENENMRGVEGMSSGTLYVVATPIGNLGDLSRRAEDVLKSVQIVAAEDTRRTAVLLQHIGHRAPELLSVHEHNEDSATPVLIARMQAGASIARMLEIVGGSRRVVARRTASGEARAKRRP